jgi:hypothetical protein
MNYFIFLNNKTQGPYTIKELETFALSINTLVYTELSDWQPLSSYPELLSLIGTKNQKVNNQVDGIQVSVKNKLNILSIGLFALFIIVMVCGYNMYKEQKNEVEKNKVELEKSKAELERYKSEKIADQRKADKKKEIAVLTTQIERVENRKSRLMTSLRLAEEDLEQTKKWQLNRSVESKALQIKTLVNKIGNIEKAIRRCDQELEEFMEEYNIMKKS